MNAEKKVQNEIMQVFQDMADSFAEKDSKKYLDLFAKNTDIVIYGSQEGEKWTSVKEYMKSVDNNWSFAEKITIQYDWIKIDSFKDVAWVATDVIFKSKIKNKVMAVPGRMTAVLKKIDDNWKIVQSHFSMEMRNP